MSLGFNVAPVAASSATNAWIFPALFGHIRNSFFAYNYALQWNGRIWRASKFPRKLIVQSAAAFSRTDAWAFGMFYRSENFLVPYNARYNGHAWRKVLLPGEPFAVSAVSRSDMWAVGPSLKTATMAPDKQVIIAMHWTGRSWHTLAIPTR